MHPRHPSGGGAAGCCLRPLLPIFSLSQLSQLRAQRGGELRGKHEDQGTWNVAQRGHGVIVCRPLFLNCATVSLVTSSSGGSHQKVAACHPHVCISAARSMLAVWSTRRGGGVPREARTHRLPIPYKAPGLPAAIPWSPCPTGAQGLPHESPWAAVGCVAPTPRVRQQRTPMLEFPVCVLLCTTGSTRAPTPRLQCALPTWSCSCVR